ncbi:Rieske (2Fe-2S) protein [Saccharicrinis aurantiacus]|uniref:Rieske (2Fe-2S) protein n=1 Tax=Saccharicrinis aurantiacus TaxID=1849719 RepID=UPI0015C541F6|nr:Rieske 2Fe-2S domain-containing protein [Saccharicrinis aurantiacus]
MIQQIKLPLFILLLFTTLSGCVKDSEDIIPNVPFHAEVLNFETDPNYNQQNPQIIRRDRNGFSIGHYGVVVYKVGAGIVYAFDLMCPYEKSGTSLVQKQDDDNYKCPTCGSTYSVMTQYGSLLEGPSKFALKPYRAEMDGNHLIIAN